LLLRRCFIAFVPFTCENAKLKISLNSTNPRISVIHMNKRTENQKLSRQLGFNKDEIKEYLAQEWRRWWN